MTLVRVQKSLYVKRVGRFQRGSQNLTVLSTIFDYLAEPTSATSTASCQTEAPRDCLGTFKYEMITFLASLSRSLHLHWTLNSFSLVATKYFILACVTLLLIAETRLRRVDDTFLMRVEEQRLAPFRDLEDRFREFQTQVLNAWPRSCGALLQTPPPFPMRPL